LNIWKAGRMWDGGVFASQQKHFENRKGERLHIKTSGAAVMARGSCCKWMAIGLKLRRNEREDT
jgi:hypothetical protein